jgi:hypothetical protein
VLAGTSRYGTIVGVRPTIGNEKIGGLDMPTLLQRILKSGAIAGGTLAVAGFVIIYLLRTGLSSQGFEIKDDNAPLVGGLFLGAIGFGLAAVLELLSSAWRAVFKKEPPKTSTENPT